MNRRRNLFIVLGGIALLLILALAASRGRHASVTTVRQQTIAYGRFTNKQPENGVLQRPRTQTIAAMISGNIGTILVRAGDRVAAGQLLATIENPQIVNSAQTSAAAYRSASARASGAALQARANLIAARTRLTQAQADLENGSQSGLGYGGGSAADQRAQAEATLANAQTNLADARRIYSANRDLYANKAISLDQLEQSRVKFQLAQTAADQAVRALHSLDSQQHRERGVLVDNLHSAQQAYAQAAAAADAAAAQADASRAGAEYAFAADQAARTQVRAPLAGTVLSVAAESNDSLRPLQPGDAVQAGQTLFTLSGASAFIVRTKVDEQDIINVHVGQRATITGEDFPNRTLGGHVIAISPVAQKSDDPSSTARQIITTIRLDGSPEFLRDGMSVDVDILTTDLARAIVVPNDAIVKEKGKQYVYVVERGVARKRAVRVGQTGNAESTIVSGLHLGDRIVAEKPVDVVDGAPVAAAPAPTNSP